MDDFSDTEKRIETWVLAQAKQAGVQVDDVYVDIIKQNQQLVAEYMVLLPGDKMVSVGALSKLVQAGLIREESPLGVMKLSRDGQPRISITVRIMVGDVKMNESLSDLRRLAGIRK